MERRELLAGLAGLAALPALSLSFSSKSEAGGQFDFLAVVHLYVSNLPIIKVEAYTDRALDRLRKSKPENLKFMVFPQRDYETYVEIFDMRGAESDPNLTDDIDMWIEEVGEFRRIQHLSVEFFDAHPVAEIKDHVMMMLGAPVISMPADIDDKINIAIELARRFNIPDHDFKEFVYEMTRIQCPTHA